MGIGIGLGFQHALPKAIHLGVTGPIKRGQGAVGRKIILICIVWHLQPINAAHVFAPAKNLTNKSFDCVQWGFAFMVGFFCGLNAIERQKEPTIEIQPDMGMKHPCLSLDHRILIVPELGQPLVDKR